MMKPEGTRWYYNRWVVLMVLFLVAGPFGLPLLWRSPQFSGRAKWLLTAAVLIYTGLLVILSSVAFQMLLAQMREFTATLQ